MNQTTLSGSNIPKRNAVVNFFETKRSMIIEIVSALLILLFVYTATSKLFNFQNFRNVLWLSPFIGNKATIVAWALPTVELLVSALLLIPRTRITGLYASTVLMITFTLYIGYMLLFSPKLPCSCGGVLKQLTWGQHLIFNIFFVGLGILAIRLLIRKKQPSNLVG